MEKNSSEFDRHGSGDPQKVVTRSGPAGLLLVLLLSAALLMIIVLGLWWWLK
jgi:uncharacterized iron-regulated membrane protein